MRQTFYFSLREECKRHEAMITTPAVGSSVFVFVTAARHIQTHIYTHTHSISIGLFIKP